ncbi:ABC transporter permease [Rehaibacterium terrae]|jgi:putative ABC transport system permease protein|uniref:Putative ABC transport system permease protein n=1 Tax=Rehaibacterium terrae TaxID=1341696 RepID=A0A7W8DD99_9GAMM|nr:ABC transporter permease [Rehaibacterium terrae]MBB5014794.1 putative ABC transport system permease protein [Rehaibacterium terrae]
MSTFRQVREIVWMNLLSIPQRLGASLVIVIGIGGVVGVLVAMLSMSTGLQKTLTATGRDDRVVILRGGANAELSSFLDRAAWTQVKYDPAVARGADGLPLASGEIIVITEVPRRGQRTGANITLRGVEPNGFVLRPEVRLLEGRRFRPGLREIIVGRGAHEQFEGLEVGRELRFRGSDWRIVGIFESGDAHDSELWTDTQTAQSAFNRTGVSSVLVQLTDIDAFEPLKRRLTTDPQLNVDVFRERDYFGAQAAGLTRQIGFLTGIVAAIMAVGALFGALNTMYSAVSARTVEIGTLRALGFGRLPVVASVMAEAMVLSLVGGLLGAGIAYGLFNGYSVSTLGGGFTQVAFNFAVTPGLVLQGLVWALGIGFLGGLMPALRAARLPVTTALRSL